MRASRAANTPPSPSVNAAGDGVWSRRWARSGSASTTPWPRASSPPSNASGSTARTSTTPGQAGGRLITKRTEPSSSSLRDGITRIAVTGAWVSNPPSPSRGATRTLHETQALHCPLNRGNSRRGRATLPSWPNPCRTGTVAPGEPRGDGLPRRGSRERPSFMRGTMTRTGRRLMALGIAVLAATASRSAQAEETWRGLVVAPESRCAPYSREDYPYFQSVETHIIASMSGRVYGPYTGRYFASRRETDIEHITATSEAHDSGLCAADAATKRRFAGDLLNLTLASPSVNRHAKSGKDAGEWMPRMNRCWFASRVVAVAEVRADGGCAGGPRPGGRPVGVRVDRDGRGRRRGPGG